MSDESTALVPTVETNEAPTVHLVARNPAEMQAARADMTAWLKGKLSEVELEVRELNASLSEARDHGWSTSALTRQRNKAVGQETFYFKLLTAVEAGYMIIPEFPIDIFAIRVTRSGVRQGSVTERGQWANPTVPDERPDVAAVGEGEYKSPSQLIRTTTRTEKNDKGESVTVKTARPTDFGELVFPLQAARPVVMNATAEAMALKVFDQIGICRPIRGESQWQGKGDPLIIGQILGQRSGYTQKHVSFIIAWHLNLNDL